MNNPTILEPNRDINSLVGEAIAAVIADVSEPEMWFQNDLPATDRISISPADALPVVMKILAIAVELAEATGRICIEHEYVPGKRHDDKYDFIRLGIRIPGLSVVQDGFDMIIEKIQNLGDLLSIHSHRASSGALKQLQDDITKWGGNIWLKGEIGRGLTVNFTLPLSEKTDPSSPGLDPGPMVSPRHRRAQTRQGRRLTDRNR